ncbi:hypothetical protein PT974_06344 [Cladobotryum mycophilum]|uniref:Uncharacterized protein n=1 Tax=Cladobotryum mycophilum TaxID=491253 RepID=A0ABR0SL77_9HYPO
MQRNEEKWNGRMSLYLAGGVGGWCDWDGQLPWSGQELDAQATYDPTAPSVAINRDYVGLLRNPVFFRSPTVVIENEGDECLASDTTSYGFPGSKDKEEEEK